ncbi:SEL1-like repeat protein [Campylobacter curvus]
MGDLYANGLGMPRDMNKAKSWYEKAKKARER